MEPIAVTFPPLVRAPEVIRRGEVWACLDLAAPGMDPVVVEGGGPFEALAEPPAGGWAFYVNDFALGDRAPWKVPAVMGLAGEVGVSGAMPEFSWGEPDRGAFEAAFRQVVGGIRRRELLKAVPVSTLEGRLVSGDLRAGMQRALMGCGVAGSGRAFAWMSPEGGFAGMTPEILFRLQGRRLTTMALAGTSDAAHESDLQERPKIAREHEIVVDELHRRLSALGGVTVSAREVVTLGTVRHLRTRLSVELPEEPAGAGLNELIRLLHPTPALGISPRSPATLRQLAALRESCRVPDRFGAPFGIVWPGGAVFAVAIRGLFWSGDRVSLPAGCGIVAGSELETEWEELELKRAWVADALRLGVRSATTGVS